MAKGVPVADVGRTGLHLSYSRAEWLARAAFGTLAFSLVAFAATVLVGCGALLAAMTNQLTFATFLGLILRVSEIVTAAAFLLGLSLHLGKLYARHRSRQPRRPI